jgi:hypothetical protein
MSSMTLASLALLKSRFEVNKEDILDSVVPFIDYCLQKSQVFEFESPLIKTLLENEFGLNLPIYVISNVANRMVKRGILSREKQTYHIVKHKIDIKKFDENRDAVIKMYNETIIGLCEYFKETFSKNIEKEEARKELFEYFDQYSIECLLAFNSNSSFPGIEKKVTSFNYMISSFINYLAKNSPEKYGLIITILTGRMLSNALLARDLNAAPMKFRETCIFIDTPIILQLIGVLGEELQKYSIEIIRMIKNANSNVAIFKHTYDEVNAVLMSAENAMSMTNEGYGSVVTALRIMNKKTSDVTLIRVNLDRYLEENGIEIKSTPKYSREKQIDEAVLEAEMASGGLHYRIGAAKLADINSVRSIYILRYGSNPRRIEDCGAVMITNNQTLARVAYAFGISYEEFREVSPIITDFALTNILWIKSPVSYKEIPERIIEAQCYAALFPSDDLWNAFLQEIEKLVKEGKITPEQHKLMRFELRIREEMMNLTLGEVGPISEQQVFKLLDRYQQRIAKPWQDRTEMLEGALTGSNKRGELAEKKIEKIAKKKAKIEKLLGIALKGILIVVFIGLYSVSEGWIPSAFIDGLGKIPIAVIKIGSIAIAAISLFSFFSGFVVFAPINWATKKVAKKIANLIYSDFEKDES